MDFHMTTIYHRAKYLTAILITSALLTGCGAEDDGIFNEASADLEACVIGTWKMIQEPEDTRTEETYQFNADHTFERIYEKNVSYFMVWIAGRLGQIMEGGDQDPSEIEAYSRSATVYGRYWDVRDGMLLQTKVLASAGTEGLYKTAVLNQSKNEVEEMKPWATSDVDYSAHNIHCDDQYLTPLPSLTPQLGTYKLISDSPLTYELIYSQLQGKDSVINTQRTTLILNNDGTGTYLYSQLFTDAPSSNISEEYELTYGYENNVITINRLCPACEVELSPLTLIDRGTALTSPLSYSSSSYLVRQ
jgi:hypothetical protein